MDLKDADFVSDIVEAAFKSGVLEQWTLIRCTLSEPLRRLMA